MIELIGEAVIVEEEQLSIIVTVKLSETRVDTKDLIVASTIIT